MLKACQPVGKRPHVAASLDVVLPTQRDQSRPVAADVARQQRQIDQREDVIDGVVVLGDAERPAKLSGLGLRIGVGQFLYHRGRYAAFTLSIFEGEGLDVLAVGVKATGRVLNELLILEPSLQNLSSYRMGNNDVGPDVKAEPTVGPLRRARPARIDDVKLRPVVDPLEDVVEVDGVGLAGVRPP